MRILIKAGQVAVYDGQVFYISDTILIGSLIDYSEAVRLLH